jgi:hypothetical protein
MCSSLENQKAPKFLKRRFLKKGWTIPHEKYHLLLGMVFLVIEITNLTSNFTRREWYFVSTESYQGSWVLVDEWPTWGSLESVAGFVFRLVFREAYSIDTLQFCYLSIDIHIVPCGIWRWVIDLGFEKQGSSPKMYTC